MDIIYKEHGEGKTTELIHRSHDTWTYIVTANRKRADYVLRKAREMGIDIPNPISWEECRNNMFRGSFIRNILIDDVDDLLQEIFCTVQIDAITITKTNNN